MMRRTMDVPPTAIGRYAHPHASLFTEQETADHIGYIAAPIVVAELRHLATRARLGALNPEELLARAEEIEARWAELDLRSGAQ